MTKRSKTTNSQGRKLTPKFPILSGHLPQEVDRSAQNFQLSPDNFHHRSVTDYRRQVKARLGVLEMPDAYVEDVDPEVVYDSQQGLCALCFTPLLGKYELDHERPLAAGGAHCYANVRAVHDTCHQVKTRTLDQHVISIWRHQQMMQNAMVEGEVRSELDAFIDSLWRDVLPDSSTSV